MEFHRRIVYMIRLLLILMVLFCLSTSTYAHDDNDLSILSNNVPSESIEGRLVSFDISQAGEILLFFQDESAYGVCTIHLLESNGKFKAEYIVTSKQSGTALACFHDDGDILIHFVRADETYAIKDNSFVQVSVPEDLFGNAEVPPAAQKKNVSHSFDGALYTLSSPGFLGSEYTLTRHEGSDEALIWSGGSDSIRKAKNRTLLFIPMIFSILGIVCISITQNKKCWSAPAKLMVSLLICVIVVIWLFIISCREHL